MDAITTSSISSIAPISFPSVAVRAASTLRRTSKGSPSLKGHHCSSLHNVRLRKSDSTSSLTWNAAFVVMETMMISAVVKNPMGKWSGQVRKLSFCTLTPIGPDLVRTGMLTGASQQIRYKVEHVDATPMHSNDPVDQQHGTSLSTNMEGEEQSNIDNGGFSGKGPYTFDLSAVAAGSGGTTGNEVQVLAASQTIYQPRVVWFAKSAEEEIQYIDRAINASIAGAAGVFAITKILTVDQDYWHGWTIFEILKYVPIHNWSAYEDALKNNPVLAKMMISGIVYSLGDWIAQCYEGKPILDCNRARMLRSGFVGFCLHGSLSHFYYHLCEDLFPFKEWWVVPLKVAFDQTIWSGIWNSIYFVTLGFLRLESPANIFSELKATFWPLLTAGWKLWPFAHVITYGVIPVEQRLLWVDCVELVWVTILSMYSNEKAEARILEAANESAAEVSESGEKS